MKHQAAPLPRLTQQQRDVCADLLSIDTRLNCFEDAKLIIDSIAALVELGEPNVNIVRWLALMPRARAAREAQAAQAALYPEEQLTLITPLAEKRGTLHMPRGRLADPDAKGKPGSRAERELRRRPPTGVCTTCGEVFEMNARGRLATKCPTHRRKTA